jgi:hypothetical protein
MEITKKDIFYGIIIILILFLGGVFYFNKVNKLTDKFDNYERTIAAINDSIHVTMKNGITEYSKKSPEIYLDEFVKSEAFKSLTADQQKYYNELTKIKGLLSATNAELQKQGTDLAGLKGANPGQIKGDSISFKLGSTLPFEQTDTTKALKWSGLLTMDKKPSFKLDYNYKFNIITTFERNKDKSIVVKYKINDPELKVNSMLNYTIPAEQKRTKLGRWIEKNQTSIRGTVLGLTFVGGGYVGYKLAK